MDFIPARSTSQARRYEQLGVDACTKLLDSTLDDNKVAGAVLVVDLYTNTGDLLEAFLTKRVSSNTPWFFFGLASDSSSREWVFIGREAAQSFDMTRGSIRSLFGGRLGSTSQRSLPGPRSSLDHAKITVTIRPNSAQIYSQWSIAQGWFSAGKVIARVAQAMAAKVLDGSVIMPGLEDNWHRGT